MHLTCYATVATTWVSNKQDQINVCKTVKRITYPYNFIIKRNETKAIPILPEKKTYAVRDIKIYFSLRWLMCVYAVVVGE